ncbi:protein FAM234B isoform X1 [Meles meles]|uniref:protein FAM234B isoform X1 n=1 Tax=Meles meles TaxID=9662 RepID=UPI001E69D97E|nr:protein FAM234B isoform X1 [Meles meles]
MSLVPGIHIPRKKSPDLGEYDPLTQADSDESEDDLVLNLQQKNGGVKNGKSPLGEVPEPDSDAEAVGAAKPHLSEVATEGYPSEPLGGLEQKATSSIVSYVRTSVFLLTLVISMILVLVCAFLIPCPPRDLHSTWSRRLGPQGGGDLSPLELADVNGDGLRDVLLSFVTSRNGSAVGVSKAAAVLVCLSGMNGSTLWSSPLPEEARDITCLNLMPGSVAETICLVTGTHRMFSAFNATSGKAIWTLNPNYLSNGTLAAPGVVLPDLDEDGVRDLVILAIGELQPDLCFLLVSGRTGSPVGRPVKYNIVGVGNLIGPQVYVTTNGAVYILFGFGNIQAVALRDIFVQAQNRDSLPPSLQIEEPEWEKRRSINLSELIDIYSDGVELLQMVKAPDSNCSNLLITTRQGLILLQGQNLTPSWTLSLQGLHSQPTPGYFTDDQTLDFLLQIQDGVGMKKMVVVDGDSGSILWSYGASCHLKETPTTSAVTADQKSVFLFWAEGMSAASPSSDVIPGTGPPSLHHLYLLHPAFPSILLDLANATGTVTASEVGINDLWKDAFYVTRTTGPSSEGHLAPLVVSKLSLRWALMEGQVVQLEDTTPKIGRGELRRFLSRIKFVDPPHQFPHRIATCHSRRYGRRSGHPQPPSCIAPPPGMMRWRRSHPRAPARQSIRRPDLFRTRAWAPSVCPQTSSC